jgi:hypothetical protein
VNYVKGADPWVMIVLCIIHVISIPNKNIKLHRLIVYEIAIQWRNCDLEDILAVYCAVCATCDREICNMLSSNSSVGWLFTKQSS